MNLLIPLGRDSYTKEMGMLAICLPVVVLFPRETHVTHFTVLTGCLHCCRSLYDDKSHTPSTPLKDAVASMG